MFRDRLALFLHGLYFANAAFFKLKLSTISLALREVGTGEILFEVGKGDGGKGMGNF